MDNAVTYRIFIDTSAEDSIKSITGIYSTPTCPLIIPEIINVTNSDDYATNGIVKGHVRDGDGYEQLVNYSFLTITKVNMDQRDRDGFMTSGITGWVDVFDDNINQILILIEVLLNKISIFNVIEMVYVVIIVLWI